MDLVNITYLNHLQDLADEASKKEKPIVNFPLPWTFEHETKPTTTSSLNCNTSTSNNYHDYIEIKNVPNKGKGFYSKKELKVGTCLLISKPLGIIMGWEEDEFEDTSNEEQEENTDGVYEEEDDDMNHRVEEEIMSEDEEYNDNNEINDVDDEKSMSNPDGDNDDDNILQTNQRNGVLTIKILKSIQKDPSLWFDKIRNLYPRKNDMNTLPLLWVCEDAKTGLEYESRIQDLQTMPAFQKEEGMNTTNESDNNIIEEIRQRLPFIVRYNCLSIETSPELFVYPDQSKGGHINLSATGLYYEPSYFNHSHRPNVSRWCIGDIMFFVINQDVEAGVELCISYIESELLCEDAKMRSILLEMDFDDSDDGNENKDKEKMKIDPNNNMDGNDDDDDVQGPVINLDVQDELMSMHPLSRLDEINRLLRQSTGSCKDGDIIDEEERDLFWFQCDIHRLRTLLALTYDNLGQSTKALNEWKKCVDFVRQKLPPVDEGGIALCVQTALCAYSCGNVKMAKEYAKIALRDHELVFGGGKDFFKRRYRYEMQLSLRQGTKALSGLSAFEMIW